MRIYINYLSSGPVHSGIQFGNEYLYARDAGLPPGAINGLIEVQTNNDSTTLEEIDSIITEAFTHLQNSHHGRVYTIPVTNGQLEILFREGVPSSAEEVKIAIREQLARIRDHGVFKDVG